MEVKVCGREKEIGDIIKYISKKIELKESGILYITGPPGTGKSMSVDLVLEKFNKVQQVKLNCYKTQTSRAIINKICEAVKLLPSKRLNDDELIDRLAKKFGTRLCEPTLVVLDELDQLPKSKNLDLLRTICSWTKLEYSKLIIVGIANTTNLTSSQEAINSFAGIQDSRRIEKIIFKSYTTKVIRSILEYYIENDPTLEDAHIEPKALDLIALKCSKDTGDIRAALNCLRSIIDDAKLEESKDVDRKKGETRKKKKLDNKSETPTREEVLDASIESAYPTPPPTPKKEQPQTPPQSPCKDRTNAANINSVIKSAKKRQRESHYLNDEAPSTHQVILACLHKLTQKSNGAGVAEKILEGKIVDVLQKYGVSISNSDYKFCLDNLETQGFVSYKKKTAKNPKVVVVLRASESEISRVLKNKETIMGFINNVV